VTVSDVALINTYALGGKGEAFATRVGKMRERWPDKAIFFSEFGSRQIGGSVKSRIPHLESVWENITRDPAVIGGALWTFNDYRSSMGGTPASGNREWGAVTVDRQPKEAYWQIRKLFSPVNSLTVTDGSVTIKPRTVAEAPSYTLRGYKIEWTLADDSGVTTAQGTIQMPDIAPGSRVWSSKIPGAVNAAKVTAYLVNPTGYRVADTQTRSSD
jgi:beta-galactosidase